MFRPPARNQGPKCVPCPQGACHHGCGGNRQQADSMQCHLCYCKGDTESFESLKEGRAVIHTWEGGGYPERLPTGCYL